MADEKSRERLLSEEASSDEIQALLLPVGFSDWQAAHSCLLRMAGEPDNHQVLIDLLPHLLSALSTVANPDRVLFNLERLARNGPGVPTFCRHLADDPRSIEILATLFAGSQFLTDILLRNPEYFSDLVDPNQLAQPRTADQLQAQAEVAITAFDDLTGQLDALRRFQRRELLRIGACDLLDLFDMSTATQQLSRLADSLVRACLMPALQQTGQPIDGFAVIAMGKLGGEELNYSSDIDLLFLAASEAARFQPLGERLIQALTHITTEGFLYRVDMRLRPWGQVGSLIPTVDGYLTYLDKHARLWEKQALLKARIIAGDDEVGADFLRRVEPVLFDVQHVDVRAEVHAMKQLTEADLRRRGRAWGEVKLGEGSIRDIEFVAQSLQLIHGSERPQVRSRNTLDALTRLLADGLLSADDHRTLADGYVFLRTIEHHLQMMHYRQTYTLPNDPPALDQLARRLRFQGEDARRQFIDRYQQHCAAIRAVYLKHLGNEIMPTGPNVSPASAGFRLHLARMDPSYADTFSEEEIARHAVAAGRLDDNHPVEVEATQLDDGRWRVTIIGFDYPGELSLICGLLLIYGFSIYDGNAFTYQSETGDPQPTRGVPYADTRRKIVDIFTVEPVREAIEADVWARYNADLVALLQMTRAGKRREARGELARRVASTLQERAFSQSVLYPVDIEIDNVVSTRYTVLNIDAPDTVGFLYEFTNALAYNRIYIARVTVESVGSRVRDTLYVTDFSGNKIVDPGKLRELRAAIVLIKHFTHLLPLSPNPETALLHFRELIDRLFSHADWPNDLASLERPEVLNALARVLGVSDFLWDDFLRMQYANLYPVVKDVSALETAKSCEHLQEEWLVLLSSLPLGEHDLPVWRDELNAFKDREMFRVDMRHILGYTGDFAQFSEELTDLAEVVIGAAYQCCFDELRAQFGAPMLEGGSPCPAAVLALGKCGGRELGFASDIELMTIYGGSGMTGGPRQITTIAFYEKLVEAFVDAIRARREGIFQIDLQLRPYGKAGSMAVSLDSFQRYYSARGSAWDYERQALVKMRPIAGDPDLGRQIISLRDEFVYTGETFNVTAMHAMRERQIRHLVTGGTLNAKYSPGGLVDVEYLVQGLQITYGHDNPVLRSTNTLEAVAALYAAGILSMEAHQHLSEAYYFLRHLINALRMVRGNAKDMTVPLEDSEEFNFLSRRMGYGSTARLHADLLYHATQVQEMVAQLLDQGIGDEG
ncbi:MAG: glutamine synthetase adenylyltransferase [Anaerolineae bacterium]|nr:glutamine synthetase adenylyltransferase [Anaerolineae bacterium]